MPVVRMATFSTCARAGTAVTKSRPISKTKCRASLIPLPSPVPNREDHPASHHQGVQQDADGQNRLHSRSARRRRATEDDPGLIHQSPDGDGEKERLQTLEDEQTPSAQ